MKIKICGLRREEDIDYANETEPDYIGFVFAESKRRVTTALAEVLRRRLSAAVTPVGVFVDAPIEEIAALFQNGVIALAQLHGNEDFACIEKLKGRGVPVIKAVRFADLENAQGIVAEFFSQDEKNYSGKPDFSIKDGKMRPNIPYFPENADFFLADSSAGSGKSFDWTIFEKNCPHFSRPWFIAGGISLENIEQAMALRPFGIDVSSGAETGGVKDLQKMRELVKMVRNF